MNFKLIQHIVSHFDCVVSPKKLSFDHVADFTVWFDLVISKWVLIHLKTKLWQEFFCKNLKTILMFQNPAEITAIHSFIIFFMNCISFRSGLVLGGRGRISRKMSYLWITHTFGLILLLMLLCCSVTVGKNLQVVGGESWLVLIFDDARLVYMLVSHGIRRGILRARPHIISVKSFKRSLTTFSQRMHSGTFLCSWFTRINLVVILMHHWRLV